MTSEPRNEALMTLAKVLGWSGLAGWLGSFIYFYRLKASSPISPFPTLGQIVQQNDHGYYFYISVAQDRILNVLRWGSFWTAAIGISIGLRMQPFKPRVPRA